MVLVAKVGTPSLSTVTPNNAQRISGHMSGEAIGAGDLCYIGTGSKIFKTNGTAVNAAAKVRGVALMPVGGADLPVTIAWGVAMKYGTGLTPGASYYASAATPGGLDTAPTTGGTGEVAFAIDDTRIFFKQSGY